VFNLLVYARYNRDGFSVYLVDNKEEKTYRTLDFEKFVEFLKDNVKNPQLLHMHFRAASSGTVSIKNVHMWRVENGDNDSEYFFVSHNGFVHKFSRVCYVPPNIYYWSRVIPITSKTKVKKELEEIVEKDIDSDTLQFIRTEDFRNALFRDLNLFNEVLEKYSFWGVLFATNRKRIVAISYGKPMHIILSNSVLYFSNEDITSSVARKKKIFGFDFTDALHTTYEDAVIVFNLEKMNVEKIIKLERKVYYYVKNKKIEEIDEETLKSLDEAYWWYY
jgi:predicted glutamine amidotransferase